MNNNHPLTPQSIPSRSSSIDNTNRSTAQIVQDARNAHRYLFAASTHQSRSTVLDQDSDFDDNSSYLSSADSDNSYVDKNVEIEIMSSFTDEQKRELVQLFTQTLSAVPALATPVKTVASTPINFDSTVPMNAAPSIIPPDNWNFPAKGATAHEKELLHQMALLMESNQTDKAYQLISNWTDLQNLGHATGNWNLVKTVEVLQKNRSGSFGLDTNTFALLLALTNKGQGSGRPRYKKNNRRRSSGKPKPTNA
jgi:hypothetical protein